MRVALYLFVPLFCGFYLSTKYVQPQKTSVTHELHALPECFVYFNIYH
jgi:hypothetical protein